MRSYFGADQRLRVLQKHDATYDTANVANVKRRGTFEEYRYDPLGRRIMVNGKAESDTICNQTGCTGYLNQFVWNGDHLIWEQYRGDANVYVHGLGIDKPLKIRSMIPHADYRGVYDAGNFASGSAISANYPGRKFGAFHDEGVPRLTGLYASILQGGTDQSGLAYRRNRYYDPATGRFTQEDPIGLAGGLNLYGYANGDPVNFSDPFGLCPEKPWECPGMKEEGERLMRTVDKPLESAGLADPTLLIGGVQARGAAAAGGAFLRLVGPARQGTQRVLQEFLGQKAAGATERLASRTLSPGVTREMLETYAAKVARPIVDGTAPARLRTPQAIETQTARLKLIEEALRNWPKN